ncbi:ATP synthase F1 subunit delta [Nitrospira sp. Kam-Ns4a]
MIKSSVARRYAKALFDLLDTGSVEPTRAGLTALGAALSASATLHHVLASPATSFEEKLEVLTALGQRVGCPTVVTSFLSQLVKKNRVRFLPEIAEAFAALADQARGARRVAVTSARPLDAAEADRIRARLKDLLRQDVELEFRTDPALIAGVQVRIGSTVFDSSVRARLTAMKALLSKE